MKMAERLSEHTKRLPPLTIGDHVRIQNQVGANHIKWDKSGIVIEVRQFDQYVVRVDGSGRATVRNRKFLRRFEPVVPRKPRQGVDDDSSLLQRVQHRRNEGIVPTERFPVTDTDKLQPRLSKEPVDPLPEDDEIVQYLATEPTSLVKNREEQLIVASKIQPASAVNNSEYTDMVM
jgi:hypothetical protein